MSDTYILQKARDLGEMIAESEKMSRLKDAETAMESDDKAKQLMEEYKKLQLEVVRATRDKKEPAVIEEFKKLLMSKQEEINEYDTTREYLLAKADFDNFKKTINDVIIFGITGEGSCSPGKCSSCVGGCGK